MDGVESCLLVSSCDRPSFYCSIYRVSNIHLKKSVLEQALKCQCQSCLKCYLFSTTVISIAGRMMNDDHLLHVPVQNYVVCFSASSFFPSIPGCIYTCHFFFPRDALRTMLSSSTAPQELQYLAHRPYRRFADDLHSHHHPV